MWETWEIHLMSLFISPPDCVAPTQSGSTLLFTDTDNNPAETNLYVNCVHTSTSLDSVSTLDCTKCWGSHMKSFDTVSFVTVNRGVIFWLAFLPFSQFFWFRCFQRNQTLRSLFLTDHSSVLDYFVPFMTNCIKLTLLLTTSKSQWTPCQSSIMHTLAAVLLLKLFDVTMSNNFPIISYCKICWETLDLFVFLLYTIVNFTDV